MMQRQQQVEDDGVPAFEPLAPRARPTTQPDLSAGGRVVEFGREVRSELRQVAWPTRPEVANSSAVVILVLVLLVALIFALNYAFSHGVIDLLNV
jgi:preprotein translocase subunit SecE